MCTHLHATWNGPFPHDIWWKKIANEPWSSGGSFLVSQHAPSATVFQTMSLWWGSQIPHRHLHPPVAALNTNGRRNSRPRRAGSPIRQRKCGRRGRKKSPCEGLWMSQWVPGQELESQGSCGLGEPQAPVSCPGDTWWGTGRQWRIQKYLSSESGQMCDNSLCDGELRSN